MKTIEHLRTVTDDSTYEHLLIVGRDEQRILLNETEGLFLALRLLPPHIADALRALLVLDVVNAREH